MGWGLLAGDPVAGNATPWERGGGTTGSPDRTGRKPESGPPFPTFGYFPKKVLRVWPKFFAAMSPSRENPTILEGTESLPSTMPLRMR